MRFSVWLILILYSALLGQPFGASAQEQKRAALQVQERKREKRAPEKAGPQLNRSALFATQVEKKLIKGIDKTVRYLSKTAKSLPKRSPQRLQILERVLNLHMEQATYTRSEEERDYERKYKAWQAGGRKKNQEPRVNTSKSLGHWKAVIAQSSDILQEYPRSENADQVTYNKAVALQYMGNEKDAARIYTQLIQKYPNSAIAGDAYASLGDYYFDRNDFNNAQTNFGKAMKYKRSKRYLWSVFKLGWCGYNLGDYKKSLTYWKQLVTLAKNGSAQDMQLREEALRDMIFAFAELKMIDEAIAYYRANNGSDYIGPFLTLLARILADQGSYAQAISVLKRFQSIAPNDPEGPTAQKEIVSLSAALGDSKVWVELENFARNYGLNSEWAKKNKKELVLETQAAIKDQMIYYAALTHQNAIKDDNRELNMEAKKGYLLFLKYHPKSAEVPGIKYYLADIEYYLKDYRSAGRYYLEIASLGKDKAIKIDAKTGKGENIHKEVSIYMVNAFVKDFEPEFKVLKKRKPDFTQSKPISARARNYIKACAKYLEWYPDDATRVKSCDVGIADIYYHSGQKENAIRYVKNIAIKYPKGKEGPAAVGLLIPIIKDDRKELLATADSFLKIPEYRNSKVGQELRNIQRASEKEDIAKEKDTLKRAQKFEAQARKYPNDPEVDKLWYNAAVDYIKAGAIPQAIEAYLVIVNRFGTKPQAKDSLLQVAQIYEKQLDYDKAADYFIEFTKKYPKEKEAPGALSTACSLQIALNTPKALVVCNAFAARYPDGALPFVEQLIIGAERAKRFDQMSAIIKTQYLSRFKLNANQQIVAYNRIFRAAGPDAGQAVVQMRGIFAGNSGSVSGEALRYIGELAFREADPILPRYLKLPLVGGTVDALAKSIENKAVALVQVEQIYSKVAATKDAYWGVAALHQMGFANEHFAEMLANPPAIQGASKDEVVKQLAPQIQERKKVAANWYTAAQNTVAQFKVYNEWSIKVISGLNRLAGKNLLFDDYVVQPDFLGSELAGSMNSTVKGTK